MGRAAALGSAATEGVLGADRMDHWWSLWLRYIGPGSVLVDLLTCGNNQQLIGDQRVRRATATRDAAPMALNAHSLFTLMYVLYSGGIKSQTECVMLEHSGYFAFRLESRAGGRSCDSLLKDASAFKETVESKLPL